MDTTPPRRRPTRNGEQHNSRRHPRAAAPPYPHISMTTLAQDRERAARSAARPRYRSDAVLAAGIGHGTPSWRSRRQRTLVATLQRPGPPRQQPVPGQLHRRLPAPAVARRFAGQCIEELERCVKELGFVGCNLNPDPSDGYWTDPPLTDRCWYPLYEKMVELDVPAMIHVSGSCNPNFHGTGAHYLNGDTTAFMQFIDGRPVQGLPDAEVRHPARRRRGALPLGPLPRHGAGHASARRSPSTAAQRLLRHLRLPPAGHQPADRGRSPATTSSSPRR